MARVWKLKFNMKGWSKVAQQVVETEGVRRMRRVADAANSRLLNRDDYRVSVEGGKKLQKRDYRATVITATAEAMDDNQRNNRLVNEFHQAGGN